MCVRVCVYVCVSVNRCVSVASAIVKRPVLPLYVEDGRCTNFFYIVIIIIIIMAGLGMLLNGPVTSCSLSRLVPFSITVIID